MVEEGNSQMGYSAQALHPVLGGLVGETSESDDDNLVARLAEDEIVGNMDLSLEGGEPSTTASVTRETANDDLREDLDLGDLLIPYEPSDDDDDDDDFFDPHIVDSRIIDYGWDGICLEGPCLQVPEDIDFEFVYALHTFVATVEGQANATKGDTMVLLDDSNSYWWLVRVVKDSSIGVF
jgi:hypothetical protein